MGPCWQVVRPVEHSDNPLVHLHRPQREAPGSQQEVLGSLIPQVGCTQAVRRHFELESMRIELQSGKQIIKGGDCMASVALTYINFIANATTHGGSLMGLERNLQSPWPQTTVVTFQGFLGVFTHFF